MKKNLFLLSGLLLASLCACSKTTGTSTSVSSSSSSSSSTVSTSSSSSVSSEVVVSSESISSESSVSSEITAEVTSSESSISSESTEEVVIPETNKVLQTLSDFESNSTPSDTATIVDLSSVDSVYEITTAGEYVLSGTLNGKVLVNVDGQVHIYLNNAHITSNDGSALAISGKKKKVVTIMEGTTNSLTDATNYTYFTNSTNDEPNASLFCKKALTINGNGSLSITAQGSYKGTDDLGTEVTKYTMGINCKDALTIIDNPTITINSKGNGIKGKDLVEIRGGTFNIVDLNDGIKSDNDTDPLALGYVYITGGNFTITSLYEGISSYSDLIITDGIFNITTGVGATTEIPLDETKTNYGIFNSVNALRLLGGTFTFDTLNEPYKSLDSVVVTNAVFTKQLLD